MEAFRKRIASESGFSLIELTTTSVVMIVVLGAALGILNVAIQAEPEIRDRNAQIQRAQSELERVTRELRVSYSVLSAGPSALTVLTYLNRGSCDGDALGTNIQCRVSYSCSSGTCLRTTSDPDGTDPSTSEPVLTGLDSDAVFSYTPDSISPSTVQVTLSYPANERDGEDAITVSDGVVMRNLPVEDSS